MKNRLVVDRSGASMRTSSNRNESMTTLKQRFTNEEIVRFLSSNPYDKIWLKNDAFFNAKIVISAAVGLTHLL